MKFKAKAAVILVLLLAGAGGIFISIRPSNALLTANGLLQSGRKYQATCEMIPSSFFPLGNKRSYTIRSVNFIVDGKSRSVPLKALDDITVFNAGLPLQVSEEGPVVILSIRAGKNEHLVQWRYLNGFFAQRRILNGSDIAIHNAEATLKAPTLVSNVPADAPRRLGSASLLSTPDETLRKASQNGHE